MSIDVRNLENQSHGTTAVVVYDHSFELGVLGFRIQQQFRRGTLISVAVSDSLFLGEVQRCEALNEGFLVHIHVEHSLVNLSGLRKTMEELKWLPPTSDALPYAS
jgi:hypothetical protein